MKQLPLVLCTLLLAVTAAHAQTESPPWKLYTIKDQDFSAALPTVPAMHINYEMLEQRGKHRTIHLLGSYADGVVYTIYIYENPKPWQTLDQFVQKQTAQSTVWDRATARALTIDGVAGTALASTDRASGMVQFFAAGDRLYKFAAFGVPDDDPRVQKFFSSIALKKKKDSVEVSEGPGLPYEPPGESGARSATGIGDGIGGGIRGVSPDDYLKIFVGREVDKKARLGMKPEPTYTESARLNAVTGTVVLKCVFARNGSVTNIRIASGLPHGLTEKAIDAARKIKFIPAIKDGKYVSMWMQLEYNFNLY